MKKQVFYEQLETFEMQKTDFYLTDEKKKKKKKGKNQNLIQH